MESEKTFILTDPITLAGKEYTELTVRKPRAKHLRGLVVRTDAIDMNVVLLAISRCVVGVVPAVIDELSLPDLLALAKVVADFLPDGLIPIGKLGSEI